MVDRRKTLTAILTITAFLLTALVYIAVTDIRTLGEVEKQEKTVSVLHAEVQHLQTQLDERALTVKILSAQFEAAQQKYKQDLNKLQTEVATLQKLFKESQSRVNF